MTPPQKKTASGGRPSASSSGPPEIRWDGPDDQSFAAVEYIEIPVDGVRNPIPNHRLDGAKTLQNNGR